MPRPSQPQDRPRLMLLYAEEAVTLTQGRLQNDLDTDRAFELALAHLIQHVGTAAGSESERPQTSYLTLDREATRLHELRNQIVHEFDPMDRVALWQAATQALPAIIPDLQALVSGLQQNTQQPP